MTGLRRCFQAALESEHIVSRHVIPSSVSFSQYANYITQITLRNKVTNSSAFYSPEVYELCLKHLEDNYTPHILNWSGYFQSYSKACLSIIVRMNTPLGIVYHTKRDEISTSFTYKAILSHDEIGEVVFWSMYLMPTTEIKETYFRIAVNHGSKRITSIPFTIKDMDDVLVGWQEIVEELPESLESSTNQLLIGDSVKLLGIEHADSLG